MVKYTESCEGGVAGGGGAAVPGTPADGQPQQPPSTPPAGKTTGTAVFSIAGLNNGQSGDLSEESQQAPKIVKSISIGVSGDVQKATVTIDAKDPEEAGSATLKILSFKVSDNLKGKITNTKLTIGLPLDQVSRALSQQPNNQLDVLAYSSEDGLVNNGAKITSKDSGNEKLISIETGIDDLSALVVYVKTPFISASSAPAAVPAGGASAAKTKFKHLNKGDILILENNQQLTIKGSPQALSGGKIKIEFEGEANSIQADSDTELIGAEIPFKNSKIKQIRESTNPKSDVAQHTVPVVPTKENFVLNTKSDSIKRATTQNPYEYAYNAQTRLYFRNCEYKNKQQYTCFFNPKTNAEFHTRDLNSAKLPAGEEIWLHTNYSSG
ncbi:MAG: hypothetical protein HZB66_03275 [Candidatus Aenigmarchaeota archaeon]|nr:hypothetical protein [Candidatus Aenigmarchaeota archaeon]